MGIKTRNILITIVVVSALFIGWQFSTKKEPKHLFTLLDSKQTGINFNNKVIDKNDHNILIYSNYYGGAGVGVGDFNNDGLQDLFFAGNLVADQLYLNEGDFQFSNITISAGIKENGGWSSGVVIADVNQDGWDDIYVTRELYDDKPELRKNKLYINQQNLTFTEEAESYGIANAERTRHATFLDYDNDGDLDLFLLNQPPNPGNYSPMKGTNLKLDQYSCRLFQNKNSKFSDITSEAGLLKAGFANSVTASDLDNDGWIDLYVTNDYDAPDNYYHNNGDGTFTDLILTSLKHTSFYSMGVDAADINNDGLLDLMVLDMVAEDNFRLKANMSGMNPENFWKVVKDSSHYQYMFNTLQLNRGLNTYSDIAQLTNTASTDWSWSNLMADFDNDGHKDIHVTNGLLRDIRNTDSKKEFTKYITHSVNNYISKYPNQTDVTIWDVIDLDEALEKVPSQKLSNYVFKNDGNLGFTKQMVAWGLDQKSFSNGSAYADLNNDGHLDLIVSNVNDKAFIYKNNGSQENKSNYLRVKLIDPSHASTFGSKIFLTLKDQVQYIQTTNVRGMYSTSEQIAHFGVGPNQNIDELKIVWPDQSSTVINNIQTNQQIEVQKINTTRPKKNMPSTPLLLDVTKRSNLNFKHKENIFDDYRHQVLLPHKLSQFGPALAVGDINNDQLDDIYIGGACGQSGALFLQTKDSKFQISNSNPWTKESMMEDMDAIFLDTDGDGDLDLYVVSGGNEFEKGSHFYQDRIYLNDGLGDFSLSKQSLPTFSMSGSIVSASDIDNDGDLDLFVGGRFIPRDYPNPASSKILINEIGTFIDHTEVIAPALNQIGLVTDAAWTDLNDDNKPDLIITGEWMPITVLIQNDSSFENKTKEFGLDATEGWWYSVTNGDFDEDGIDEFVFGNIGQNYKYKASAEEPFEVFYNDFDQNGNRDIVLSYYNFGVKFPVRGKSCSSEQVPLIGEKFQSYEKFASANLEEIYGNLLLDNSLHRKSVMFQSAVGKLDQDGKIRLKSLPIEAQFSSVNDCNIIDINDDGYKDLVIAGNLYTSEIETPRNDASIGLVLLGDGNGHFQSTPATTSGLYLNKDVKKLKHIKIGNENHIVVASNDDEMTVYKLLK